MSRADDNLARMRDNRESDWPSRLLHDLTDAPLIDEEWLDRANHPSNMLHPDLSPAELRVLEAASYGLEASMIADLYGISFFTVNDHLKAARVKLRAKNTTHACCVAVRQGVIR